MKKKIAVFLTLLLVAGLCLPAAAETPAEQAKLRFKDDGTFRILNFSDFQDDEILYLATKCFIQMTVKELKPDLIVLTGDNIAGYSMDKAWKCKKGIREFMNIFEVLGVPVAFVFGNHDEEHAALTKEEQMEIYAQYSVNIAYDEGEALSGCGTYNVPIYASNGSEKVAFNLWMFDSGDYDKTIDYYGYDHVKQDQLDWYEETRARLAEENGGNVPAIAFQHIIVPEIYDALQETDETTEGAIRARGTYYVLPETAAPGSILGEAPCPSETNSGEFDTLLNGGDVLACVSGHDHVNSFVISYRGIDLVNTPTCGYNSYGNEETRGARVIDLNEKTPGTYETFTVLLPETLGQNPASSLVYQLHMTWLKIKDWVVEQWDRLQDRIGK